MARHPMYDMVDNFMVRMYDKLEERKERYGYSGFVSDDWEEKWQQSMKRHLTEGNMVDVANYAMFGDLYGWKYEG